MQFVQNPSQGGREPRHQGLSWSQMDKHWEERGLVHEQGYLRSPEQSCAVQFPIEVVDSARGSLIEDPSLSNSFLVA